MKTWVRSMRHCNESRGMGQRDSQHPASLSHSIKTDWIYKRGRTSPHFVAPAGRRGRSSEPAFDSCETEIEKRIEGLRSHAAPRRPNYHKERQTAWTSVVFVCPPKAGLIRESEVGCTLRGDPSSLCTSSWESGAMHRAFSFPGTVERSRTKERLEASLAGLCELELRKQRQECLVLGALALGHPRGELGTFSSWGQENLTLRRQLVRSLFSFTACLVSSSSTVSVSVFTPHTVMNPTSPLAQT